MTVTVSSLDTHMHIEKGVERERQNVSLPVGVR